MSELPARLILASASPRRRELLAQAGYAFRVEAADVDESVRAGETPEAYVRRLAEEKARAVFARYAAQESSGAPSMTASSSRVESSEAPLLVLGADTTVVCDGDILAKPDDAEHAKQMLRKLSGRTHQVLTGVAVIARAGTASAVEITDVTFSNIPEAELDLYCATHEPLDKAGAYGIQGYAARWIPRIDGDYFNVVGLPIARVVRLLEDASEESGGPAL
jgi:septum formation protein